MTITTAQVQEAISVLAKATDLLEQRAANISKVSVPDQVRQFLQVRDVHDAVYDVKKRLHNINEEYKNKIIPSSFEKDGISNFKLDTGEQVVLQPQMNVKTTDKDGAINWLRENELGELVQETVNASSLKGLAGEFAQEGKELPDSFFKVDIWSVASIRKGKPSKKK